MKINVNILFRSDTIFNCEVHPEDEFENVIDKQENSVFKKI